MGIQEEDKVCDNEFLIQEWGPNWKSDEGINACRDECNKDLDCNAFSWLENFTCRTYSECNTLIDNEFKSKAFTYKKDEQQTIDSNLSNIAKKYIKKDKELDEEISNLLIEIEKIKDKIAIQEEEYKKINKKRIKS